MSVNYTERARALVGTRFRPQGRGIEGLDCVGVILWTFEIDPGAVRRNYRLRGDLGPELKRGLLQQFRRIPPRSLRFGDVMVMRVAADQLHLGVRTPDGFVHAHAGIGYVVETPGMPDWPVLGLYRKRRKSAGL